MKRIYTVLICLLPIFCLAQQTEGKIVFEEKMNMHVQLDLGEEGNDEMMEQLKAMMPEYRIVNKVLHFTEEASIYKNHTNNEPQELSHESEGMAIQMKFEEPENILHKNLSENRSVQLQEFFTRKFLIKDEIKSFKWKLTGESKEVMGFMCQQAISGDTSKVIAWFSPEIPVSSGPGKYGQLPGMILELEANDGKLKISATSITFEAVDKKEMAEPKKGKVVTRDEFEKIREEKMKEMQMEMGGSGGNRIIIRN
ncbi:MAG: GLPGLI family protein [Bacteroidota bacterium]